MSLTIHIIEHELAQTLQVMRSESQNTSYDGVRLYLGDPATCKPQMLYVVSTDSDVRALQTAGCDALYVHAAQAVSTHTAALEVINSSDPLAVFDLTLDIFARYANWEKSMDYVALRDGGLQALINVSSAFLQNHVVIVDPALKLLAYTKDTPCDDPITAELITHGYHTAENIQKFKLHKRFKPWSERSDFIINDTLEICKYTTVARSFTNGSSFSLIIIMMCNVTSPDPYLLDTLSMFAERVGRFAEKEYPDDKPIGNATDTFLRELFSGEITDLKAIRERSNHVSVPYKARFCLFYIGENTDSIPTRRLLSDVARMVAPAKTISVHGACVVLCYNCQTNRCGLHCESGSCPLGHKSISARLNEFLSRNGLIAGRSSKFTSLAMAKDAYSQAKEAFALGTKKKTNTDALGTPHNFTKIFSFDRCCMDYLVAQCSEDNLAGKTYASYVLGSIAAHDEVYHTDNYIFLYEYLLNERRAQVVADKMHMHRNNVKYRIDRIEKDYGIDTTNALVRYDFLLAYRIREASIVQNAQ